MRWLNVTLTGAGIFAAIKHAGATSASLMAMVAVGSSIAYVMGWSFPPWLGRAWGDEMTKTMGEFRTELHSDELSNLYLRREILEDRLLQLSEMADSPAKSELTTRTSDELREVNQKIDKLKGQESN